MNSKYYFEEKGEFQMSAMNLRDVFKFGKHKGEQVEDVITDDPDYIAWLFENDVVEFDDETNIYLLERKVI